jgi:tRNA threonylcarbamoyl adenosine modification protein (Sua5/YciO/YrdC/YwlC family)
MATLFDLAHEDDALPALHQAHAALTRGEVLVVPTDTVYGVAVSPKVPGAIDTVVGLKGRSKDMAPPILVATVDQVVPLVAEGALSDTVHALLQRYWPGALTVVLPVNESLPFDIGHTPGTIALRSPDDQSLLELLRIHGPLAVTSANRTGEPPCQSVFEAINTFGDEVAVYLGATHDSQTDHLPSSIVDASDLVTGGVGLRLIREGAISAAELRDAGYEVSAA